MFANGMGARDGMQVINLAIALWKTDLFVSERSSEFGAQFKVLRGKQ